MIWPNTVKKALAVLANAFGITTTGKTPTTLAAEIAAIAGSPAVDWADITNKPADPENTGTYLIAGGNTVLASGYTFRVSAASYVIQGQPYSAPQTELTLLTADATHPRIDVIVATSTNTIQVLPGTPAATPVKPEVDPFEQLELTFVLVDAASVEAPVSQTAIYREGSEWTDTGSAAVNLASATSPAAGSVSVEFTNALSGEYAQFVAGSPLVPDPDSLLVFLIKSKAAWPAKRGLKVSLLNGTTPVGVARTIVNGSNGFDSAQTTSYQQLALPLSLFAVPSGSSIDRVRFEVTGSQAGIGFHLDEIFLQGDLYQPPQAVATVEPATSAEVAAAAIGNKYVSPLTLQQGLGLDPYSNYAGVVAYSTPYRKGQVVASAALTDNTARPYRVVDDVTLTAAITAPPFRSAGAVSTAFGWGATLTLAKPAGVQAGDLLVACIVDVANFNVRFTTPSGWTQAVVQDGGTRGTVQVFTRIADGTEGASAAFVVNPDKSVDVAGKMLAYQGGTTLDAYAALPSWVSGNALPTVTTTAANDLVLSVVVSSLNATSEPAGWTEREDGTGKQIAIFERTFTAAGSIGTHTATGGTSTSGFPALTVAFKGAQPAIDLTGNASFEAVDEPIVRASKVIPTSGNTASRPSGVAPGFQYFDTTLGKPVWWSGSAWKDATGTTV